MHIRTPKQGLCMHVHGNPLEPASISARGIEEQMVDGICMHYIILQNYNNIRE